MIPSLWTWLESLPMAVSGKLDRTRLEADQQQPEGGRPDQHLSSPIERRVADVWQDVLCVASVYAPGNFVLVVGRSLLLLLVVFRLGELLVYNHSSPRRLVSALG